MFRLRYPVKAPRLTQPFGARPEYYRRFGLPGHEGVDFGGQANDPIYAAADGVVTKVFRDDWKHPYGTHIRITHLYDGQDYTTVYAHLSSTTVKAGDVVKTGDVIGGMGTTGNSSGVHLHFSLVKKGATARGETHFPRDILDPTPYFRDED